MMMRRLWPTCVLLFASAIPVFGRGDMDGPKSWFHHNHTPRGPAASYYRGNHHVARQHSSKHPKPHHNQNLNH